jgi:hypothetical protein
MSKYAWRDLERLSTMAASFPGLLARAAEYGDATEISRLRGKVENIAKQRRDALTVLSREVWVDAWADIALPRRLLMDDLGHIDRPV